MNRLLRRLRAEDSGISMIELLVSMMLSAVLLTLVGTMFVNVARATTNANTTRQAATVAGTIANDVARSIRFSVQNPVQNQLALDPAVIAATPTSLTLSALVDTSATTPVPTKLRYSIVDGRLVAERWTTTTTAGGYFLFGTGTPTSSRVLGGTISSPAGSPLFTYLDGTGATLTPGATGLTAAQRATVAAIRITVQVQAPGGSAAPVMLENTVGMPNLGYAGEGAP
ncbi:MAG: hypothetical protein JWP66_786 [Naasia sp.]|nr:hypothetical protein [Naasia sp.]